MRVLRFGWERSRATAGAAAIPALVVVAVRGDSPELDDAEAMAGPTEAEGSEVLLELPAAAGEVTAPTGDDGAGEVSGEMRVPGGVESHVRGLAARFHVGSLRLVERTVLAINDVSSDLRKVA
jgi:hypothetical protein